MNEFFYVSRGKEKIKDLRHEGMQNQAFHRSGAMASSIFSHASPPKAHRPLRRATGKGAGGGI